MALAIRKHLSRRNIIVLVAALLAIMTAACIAWYSYTNAATVSSSLTDRLTNDNIGTAGGIDGAVDLHLKKLHNIAYVLKNRMGAYYPRSGDGKSPKNKSIKILQGKKGRVCNVDGNIKGKLIIEIKVDGGEKTYSIPMQQVCNGSAFYGRTFNFPTSGQLWEHDSGYYEARIEVRYNGDVNESFNSEGNDLNYDMQLLGGSSKRILALRENKDPQQFGLRSAWMDNPNAAGNQQVRAEVPFGYPCTETEVSMDQEHRTVQLYDADGVFGDTYMWVTKKGNKLDREDYDKGASYRIGDWDDTRKAWKLPPSNRDFNKLVIKKSLPGKEIIKPGVEYKLIVYNDGNDRVISPHYNTLSVAIPHDSIYAEPTCDYKLDPSVDPPAKSKSSVVKGAKISVRGHVAVTDGYDNDSHAWQLTAKVYDSDSLPANLSGASNGLDPCAWRGGTCDPLDSGTKKFKAKQFDTNTYQYDTASLDADSWVCFVMSVLKPSYNAPAARWKHSAMKCVSLGSASPGTTVTPNTYSYYPKLEATSVIKNENAYPKIDNWMNKDYIRKDYEWKLIEAKFSSKPSSIGTADKGGCNTVKDVGGFLNGSCRVVNDGNNLFPYDGSGPRPCSNDPCTKTASSKQEGPDPIGTWTCYTFSYLTNPEPLDNLMTDINWYRNDWNDPNHDSENPRWGDGYWEEEIYVPPVYDEDTGEQIGGGYYYTVYHGHKKSNAEIQALKDSFREDSIPPKYKFTPYKRASCSISGVDPKVQIRSNDLKVTGSINTSLRTMEVGPAVGTYGSTGEYGVLSGGANIGLASGSGLLRGGTPDQGDWSTLTFTNNTPGVFGNFNSVPEPNVISSDEGVAYSGQTSFGSGDKIVYKVVGTLVINSNLTYSNTYSRVTQVPRVVIIADNIEIGPNVTRIDPWLIAENISTCGPPKGVDWGASSSDALGAADLKTGECSRPLIFNGPVYASNIYLYRTGGSRVPKEYLNDAWTNPDSGINPDDYCEESDCGNGPTGRKYALSAPAEVFNLRPDAFLSSFAGTSTGNPVATTDKVTELPPRF